MDAANVIPFPSWPDRAELLAECLETISDPEATIEHRRFAHGLMIAYTKAAEEAFAAVDDFRSNLVRADYALAFVDEAVRAGRGVVTFGMTEDGDVGVWIFDDAEDAKSNGVGDTAKDALFSASKSGRFSDIVAGAFAALEVSE